MLAALGLEVADDARPRHRADTGRPRAAAKADASGLDRRLADSAITIMSDVNNPLCGERRRDRRLRSAERRAAGRHRGARCTALRATLALAGTRAVGRKVATGRGRPPADWASRCSSSADRSAPAPKSSPTWSVLDAALEGATWAFTGRRPHRLADAACARRRSSSPNALAPQACRSRSLGCCRRRARCRTCRASTAAASRCLRADDARRMHRRRRRAASPIAPEQIARGVG